DPDERIDVDEPRVRKILTDGFAGGDVGAGERGGEAAPVIGGLAEGRAPRPFAAHVAPEGGFIDGADAQWLVMRAIGDVSGGGFRVGAEAPHELVPQRGGTPGRPRR